jgi:hypothetical protein
MNQAESVHKIRLAGPWQFEYLPRIFFARNSLSYDAKPSDSLPRRTRQKIVLPIDWSAWWEEQKAVVEDEANKELSLGGVAYYRKFNLPTGLTSKEVVTLVIAGLADQARVGLNGEWLTSQPLLPDRLSADLPSQNDDPISRFKLGSNAPPRETRFLLTSILTQHNELSIAIPISNLRSVAMGDSCQQAACPDFFSRVELEIVSSTH